ncbi:MAG TPA: NAD(P)/FAD-dependent oxidoreductase [Actinomycetes bacterium]|nr:NAD(P)/FAD-dependent oxidoreductase [Actinomycetes bacterium]
MVEQARVLVVGGGFGGVHCARRLERLLGGRAQLTIVNPENYMLFTPLLPEAAAGTIQPRHVGVPLRRVLRRTRVVVGEAIGVDLEGRTVTVRPPEGPERLLGWDRLVLAPGSVSRRFPIPGLDEHAYGFKTLAEGIHVRNHVLRMLELADATDDEAERRMRCTFAVVGAGYAGTELIAELQALVRRALPNYPRLGERDLRWLLIDVAPQVLPELGGDLGERALAVLRRRGIEIRLSTTVEKISADWIELSGGERIPVKTLVWTAGIATDPLIAPTGLPTDERGRVRCDAYTRVEGHRDVYAVGDAAAIPDPAHPGRAAPPTAQHAQREGRACARNVAASLGVGEPRPFHFRGLGLLVNLAGRQGVGRVLGVPVSGLVGWVFARGYHLLALPTLGRRMRVAIDWLIALGSRPDIAELGSLGRAGPLSTER